MLGQIAVPTSMNASQSHAPQALSVLIKKMKLFADATLIKKGQCVMEVRFNLIYLY